MDHPYGNFGAGVSVDSKWVDKSGGTSCFYESDEGKRIECFHIQSFFAVNDGYTLFLICKGRYTNGAFCIIWAKLPRSHLVFDYQISIIKFLYQTSRIDCSIECVIRYSYMSAISCGGTVIPCRIHTFTEKHIERA